MTSKNVLKYSIEMFYMIDDDGLEYVFTPFCVPKRVFFGKKKPFTN